MFKLVQTDSQSEDFKQLVSLLDEELAIRDGDDHAFYHQFNKIDALKYVVVSYVEGVPVGCGAMKEIQRDTVEFKRMYVLPKERGKGIAKKILKALEDWATALKYNKCRLETGKKQPEAIGLYGSNNYSVITNYGPYVGVDNSICFEKKLKNEPK